MIRLLKRATRLDVAKGEGEVKEGRMEEGKEQWKEEEERRRGRGSEKRQRDRKKGRQS